MRIFRAKYSVEQIDEMRRSLYAIYQDFSYKITDYEEKLRTYMLNGTSPEELKEKEKKAEALRKERGLYHDV